ncbi:MAG: hypothetical protein RMN25_13005 [Anaerolineae bacterium]|nr:hypothetical protein [Thermoflexales bacterium]MDW8408691.1 hypothetical protein [Anaerolineae bacterium]
MHTRQRILAALNYGDYDRLPILHFGFWEATLKKWAAEGHFELNEYPDIHDGSPAEDALSRKLGFDDTYHRIFAPHARIWPPFEPQVIELLPDGMRKVLNSDGVIVLQGDDADGIPAEIDHTLKGRKEWDEIYKERYRFFPERVSHVWVNCGGVMKRFDQGGKDYLLDPNRETHILLHCGSLYGAIRDVVGVVNLSYLASDDEALFDEIIETNAELCYRNTETALASGVRFDIGHFWEDICYKNGPLVSPRVFHKKVGPHYRRITDLLRRYGIDLVSLDCDGMIDHLIPTWIENGINIMFPIEVGTWGASLAPWRAKYGKVIRGVGGVDKRVFAQDYAAVDAEIERLKPLVELGGYLPCIDHRIPVDAKWENVQYYCDRMRQTFG